MNDNYIGGQRVVFYYPYKSYSDLYFDCHYYDTHSKNYHYAYYNYVNYHPSISDKGFSVSNWNEFNNFIQSKINTYNSEVSIKRGQEARRDLAMQKINENKNKIRNINAKLEELQFDLEEINKKIQDISK